MILMALALVLKLHTVTTDISVGLVINSAPLLSLLASNSAPVTVAPFGLT